VAVTNLKSLVGKLNSQCKRALEGAAGLCVSRTNYNVEIEHWLLKLLEQADGDLPRLIKHYNLDIGKVVRELTRSVDQLKTGSSRGAELSMDIIDLMRESWTLASLEYGAIRIRSGYLLAALLGERNLSGRIRTASPELAKIPSDQLNRDVKTLITGSVEDTPEPGDVAAAATGGQPGQPAVDSKTPNLDQFTYDLTAQAKSGKLDAVIGRDFEIRQVIDILTRRRQNNPILTGEAGVGKTAVVEGFALKVVAGDVPPPLKGVVVRSLDLSLLQAGAGVKGEFENRLKGVIQEVKSSPVPIILFIDEAHTLIGAGGAAGSGDAANLIKPALARGELRTIAATTRMEYKKYFEGDPALKRRFQEVRVDEPSVDLAIKMMRGLTAMLEKHHKVRILAEAVEDAVKLSHRYISERQLPDKCISLLDTACAKVALSQSAVPAALESSKREIEFADVEIGILEREIATGANHSERLAEVQARKTKAQADLKVLEERLAAERALVEVIRELRAKLEAHAAAGDDVNKAKDKLSADDEAKAKAELAAKNAELSKLQGETGLIQPFVSSAAVAEVVSSWTGIPIGKMVRNEIESTLRLKDTLAERVVGQNHALEAIAQRIRTARANLSDPKRPLGVFMLVGPSGTGKTETAIALADLLYGGDRNMVVINMSEFKEEYKVSQLLGPPPGYEGSDRGGVLTEAVRRRPYSIVLLDEVEKSHPSVQEIFYQVFDKGTLSDSRGNEVNFKNTIILLTSNVGTDTIMKVTADPDTKPEPEGLAAALMPDLIKTFKPALVGRMTVVPYYPLTDEVLKKIIKLKVKAITDRVRANYKAEFICEESVIDSVASRCKEVDTGARNADHILTGTLLPELAQEFLSRMAEGKPITKATVGVGEAGRFTYHVE
jgi:type VI secretion system protein VasG